MRNFKIKQYLEQLSLKSWNKKRMLAGVMVGTLALPLVLPVRQALALEDSVALHMVRTVQKAVVKATHPMDEGIHADNWRGDELLPSEAELKKELDIKQIISNHCISMSIILRGNGDVWGLGVASSLGLKQEAKVWTKLPVKGVKKLWTSGYNTFALCKNGDVWSVGPNNTYGGRAVGDTENHVGWTKVNIDGVKEIAVSIESVVFLKYNGEVWGAGCGSELGMDGKIMRPVKLAIDGVKSVYGCYAVASNYYPGIWFVRHNGEIRKNVTQKFTKVDLSQISSIVSASSVQFHAVDIVDHRNSGLTLLSKAGDLYLLNSKNSTEKDLESYKVDSGVTKILNSEYSTGGLVYLKGGKYHTIQSRPYVYNTKQQLDVKYTSENVDNYLYMLGSLSAIFKDGTLWSSAVLGSRGEIRETMTCLNSIILDDTIDTINSVYNYEDLEKYQELKLGLLGRERYTKEHIYFADGKVNKLYDLPNKEKEEKYIFRCQNGDALIQTKKDNKIQFVKMGTTDLQEVTGKIDTPIIRAFTGVVDTKMVSMVELKDGNIAWLDDTVLKELPLAVKDMKSNFLFRNKDGVKMLFQKQDGSLWWYDSDCKEHEVLGVNMRKVKDICKGLYDNTDMFVMSDATLRTLERPLLTDGRKVVERLSDGFLRLNDDKVYARTGDLAIKEVCDYKDYLWCTNLQLVTKNYHVYSTKGHAFATNWTKNRDGWADGSIPRTKFITDLSTDSVMYFDTKGTPMLSTGDLSWSIMSSSYVLTHLDISKTIPDYKQIIGAYYIGNTEYLLLKDGTFRSVTDGSALTSAKIVGGTIGKLKAKSKLNFDVAKDCKDAIIELEAGDISNVVGIKNMLDKITDEGERKALWDRYQKALTKAEPAIGEVTELIGEFEKNPSRDVLDRIDIAILKIKDPTIRADYTELVEDMKQKYKDKLVREANEAMDEANRLPTQDNYDRVEKAINKLESGEDKDDLTSRLQDLKDQVKENEEYVKAYGKALQDYKGDPTSENYDRCKQTIESLPAKEFKDNANVELEKERQKVLTQESEILVRKAEDSKLLTDVEKAKAKVNLITDDTTKQGFIKRLDAIDTSSNPANTDSPEELDKVSKLVDKAVASGQEVDVKAAKEAIDKLKFLEHKFMFNSKLALTERNLEVDMTPFSKPSSAETSFQVQMGVLPNITIKVDKPFVDLGNVDLVKDTTLENPIHVLVNSNMPYDVYAKSDDIKATKGNGTIPADHLMMGLDDNGIRPLAKDREVHLADSIKTGDKVFGTKFKFKQYKDARPGVYRTTVKLVARQK